MVAHHIKQALIAAEQLLNATLFLGWADECISARAWRQRFDNPGWGKLWRVIDWTAQHIFRQQDHCYKSWLSEFNKHQLPPAYRS